MTNKILYRPSSLEVLSEGPELIIKRKWFSWIYFLMLLFLIVWLIFIFQLAEGFSKMDGPVIFTYFPILFYAAGAYLGYYTIAGFLNTTEIRASSGKVSIKHKPVPWPGNKELNTYDLQQLFTKKVEKSSNNGTNITYEVIAIMRDGEGEVLVKGLTDESEALFIEKRLEELLGIKDRPVEGEMGKD